METWGMGNKSGTWDEHIHSTIYKIDNQQDTGNYQIFCDNLYGKESKKE